MKKNKRETLFEKYLAGTASEVEMEELMRTIDKEGTEWLDASAEKVWKESQVIDVMDAEEAARLKGKIYSTLRIDNRQERTGMPYWMRVAAIFLPILAGTLVFYFVTSEDLADAQVAQQVAVQYVEKINPKGQKSTITLEDGTVVNLNSDSKLIYKKPFDEQRMVILEGEAFFNVAQDPDRPFVIHTESITTTVLGTSFNIRAYRGAREVLVAVATGKVRVEKKAQEEDGAEESLVLTPNEMGQYSAVSNKMQKLPFDELALFGWKDGVIYFKDANFKEVKERLEQWYGVTFLTEKHIDNRKDFTGTYKNKPLSSVLEGVSFVYDFEFEINDKMVIIK